MKTLAMEDFYRFCDDFEKGWYFILAALKESKKNFSNLKLEPTLKNISALYVQLRNTLEQFDRFHNNIKNELIGFDLEQLRVKYRMPYLSNNDINTAYLLMKHAAEEMESILHFGDLLAQEILNSISIRFIGISPPTINQGYVHFCRSDIRKVYIYLYKMKVVVDTAGEKNRLIHMKKLEENDEVVFKPIEKLRLMKNYPTTDNPALLEVKCKEAELYPFEESVLPVTKIILLSHAA